MAAQTKAKLKKKLEQARQDLLQWCQTLEESDWTQPVYVHDEEWTVQDVLRHLTWAEGGMARLIQQIREGHEGVPPDFDLDRYNARGVDKLKDRAPAELMAMMTENREWILRMLDEMDQDELQLAGRHGSMHIMSIAEIFRTIAIHERQHLRELRRAITGAPSQPA